MSFCDVNTYTMCSIEASNEFRNEEMTSYTPYLITYQEETGNFIYSDPWIDLSQNENNLSNENESQVVVEDNELSSNSQMAEEDKCSTHFEHEQRDTVESEMDEQTQEPEVSAQLLLPQPSKMLFRHVLILKRNSWLWIIWKLIIFIIIMVMRIR